MRFYDDLTEAQTADVLSVSRNTVKSQTRLAFVAWASSRRTCGTAVGRTRGGRLK